MKITKIYFPNVIAIRLEEKGREPRYYSQMPGKATLPCTDLTMTDEYWRESLSKAKTENVKIEVTELP